MKTELEKIQRITGKEINPAFLEPISKEVKKVKVYSTDKKIKKKRRRIGEFSDKITRFKQSFNTLQSIKHELNFMQKYGLELV